MSRVMPTVGVVIPCYNEGPLLKRAWKSLDAQSDADFDRVIVNDDPSHAETAAACCELEHKGARVVWHDRNRGTAAARNTACGLSDADIIVPLDADDTLPPDTVRLIRRGFQETPEADFLFGDYFVEEVEKRARRRVRCAGLTGADGLFLDLQKIARRFGLYGGSPFRRSLWKRIGGYDPAVPSGAEDLDFWLRALAAGARGRYLSEVIYEWRRSRQGSNSRVTAREWDAVYEKNKAFFVAAGERVWRRLAFRRSLYLGEFVAAQKEARRLVQEGERSRQAVFFAFSPVFLAGPVYSLKKRMFGVARPF